MGGGASLASCDLSAAIARYKKYGKLNQLRTWHEVFNCAPETGILPYFEAERLV
jgi:aldoxime dehydratase